ncbi:uncharacterized protein BO72DRAFT_506778 [Aspergillus fijiensis CBS 313.89]|uniref:Carrier domain-containing protein n=1 Tax=Aspergillus fijiensis CBS 313.89 TaxID=1448319 RepID=A0A8G1RYB1_9EURO|nr:uncharacterized protein BO72DRAFT_506778 [Aspergillus fijiensis CBS 313.89]RAK79026.1 hypothetical protein BO72DRAFT_506778 [Aspergillus fijiensis CBS 313.89]
MDLRPPRGADSRDLDPILVRRVAQVWASVLAIELTEIKPTLSFFLLGGNSLSAMRACKELRHEGILLSMSDLFLHPTLTELVDFIMKHNKTMSLTEPSHTKRSTEFESTAKDVPQELLLRAARDCAVDPKTIEDIYPCTALQTGLMALSEIHAGAYVAEHAFHLPVSWTVAAFQEAWLRVLAVTPILRTRIIRDPNGRSHNVTLQASADPGIAVLQGVLPVFIPPMSCGSPLFCHSLDTDPEHERLIWRWRVHHAIYDRWSTHLILDLMQKMYREETPSPLTPFSRFARAAVEQESSEAAISFWRNRFESFSGTVFPQLPLDHGKSRASDHLPFEISIPPRRSATTQATTIQGALALLISKVHGESNVIFGTTNHGRALAGCPDAETVVGPAIATVPMRIQVEGATSVAQFLDDLQTQAALVSDYEHYGLQNIKALGPGPAAAASFTTLLIIQPEMDGGEPDPLHMIHEIELGTADGYVDYPLVVECFPKAQILRVKLLYDPVVFSSWEMQMMARQFKHAFDALHTTQDPTTLLRDLSLLDKESVPTVLRMSRGELIDHRECLHERIFAKAHAWPDSEALHGWDTKYTYEELRRLVRRLTLRLAPLLPCKPGQIVPICYPKSAAAVVAMLSILTAGHAFLLLDPALPPQRIRYMIQAAKADRVLCTSATHHLVADMGPQVVNLQSIWDTPSVAPDDGFFELQTSPDRPAYCIFTSGSTGAPKGVVLLHRQVTSGLESQITVGLYKRQTRLLQFASYSFDTCIADIFATLLSGGCVCVPQDEDRLLRLADNINAFAATAVDMTPSVARMLQPHEVPNLQVLRLGGEPMHQYHVQTWANRCNLQNTYGPTECCVQCTFVDRVPESLSPAVIGKSIGCHLWVVDPQNHKFLMPLGMVGELAIQGPAVADGYINNPAKTEELFLPHAPWLDTYGIDCLYPVYLTGDLVRFNEQGDLVFLGRRDSQIKIRGQRVEPEEIEHVLQQDERMDQALVCYPTTGVLAMQLVAVLEPSPAAARLRAQDQPGAWMEPIARKAAEFLPLHMVPAVFLVAGQSLLMSSGKLNRRSVQTWLERLALEELEALHLYHPASARPHYAKSTETVADLPDALTAPILNQIQSLLAWRSHIGRQAATDLSLVHSFSRIGLDSITIIPFLRWINQTHSVQLDVPSLLQLDSVQGLVSYLRSRQASLPAKQKNRSDERTDDPETFEPMIRQGMTLVRRLSRRISSRFEPRRVLLTGGTSLVGLNILTRLLERFPRTRVVVLVRCERADEGKARLLERASLLRSWRRDFTSRIEVWPGDLSATRLGLLPAQWDSQLGGRGGNASNYVDAVIHNGAVVDWFASFATLQATNIDATLQLTECVRDATAITRLVYVSGGPQWMPDEPDTAALEPVTGESSVQHLHSSLAQSNPYGCTKLITGAILQRAAARSMDLASKVAVLRPALIIGAAADGVVNMDDFLWRVVRGCCALGAFPREDPAEDWIYLCGADYFADLIISQLTAALRPGEIKVHAGLTASRFWAIVQQELGVSMEALDVPTWLHRLRRSIAAQTTHHHSATQVHPCQPILHMLEGSWSGPLGAARPRICADTDRRRRMEAEAARVVTMNVRYMHKIGSFSTAEEAWSDQVFHRNKTR